MGFLSSTSPLGFPFQTRKDVHLKKKEKKNGSDPDTQEAGVYSHCKEVVNQQYCNYFHIHEVCENPSEIKHPFFEELLVFLDSKYEQNRHCDACGLDIEGSSYHSSCGTKKCRGHYLHPCCALNLKVEITTDHVKLFLMEELSSECGVCGRRELRIDNIGRKRKSWGYVSEDEKYQLHLYCVKKNWLDKNDIKTTLSRVDRQNGELGMMSLGIKPAEFQIEARDRVRIRTRGSTTLMLTGMIKFVFDLIVAVVFGNPIGLITDVASLLLYD